MKCPMRQCQSEDVELAGGKVETGGKLYHGLRCRNCGYFWSVEGASPSMPPTPAPAPEITTSADGYGADNAETGGQAEPTAGDQGGKDDQGDGAGAGGDAGKTEPRFDETVQAKDVKLGNVIKVRFGDGEKLGPVVKITRKTFLLDFDGAPDKRVAKTALIGRLIQG